MMHPSEQLTLFQQDTLVSQQGQLYSLGMDTNPLKMFIDDADVADTESERCRETRGHQWRRKEEWTSGSGETLADTPCKLSHGIRGAWNGRTEFADCSADVADSCSAGQQEFDSSTEPERQGYRAGSDDSGGAFGKSESRVGRDTSRFSNWMDGHRWPAALGQSQYEWEPPRVATGIKNRVARLKALGNAVIPQQIYPILKAIADMESR